MMEVKPVNREFENYLKDKDVMIFSSEHPDYKFLDEGEQWICLTNPNRSEDLMVRYSDDLIYLFFDQWSQTFSNDSEGLRDLIHQINDIMDDKAYLWKAKIGSHDFVSLVSDDPGVFYEVAKRGFKAMMNGQMISLDPDQIEQSFVFWDPQMMEPEKTLYLN